MQPTSRRPSSHRQFCAGFCRRLFRRCRGRVSLNHPPPHRFSLSLSLFVSSIRPLILSLVLDFTREESVVIRILDVDLGFAKEVNFTLSSSSAPRHAMANCWSSVAFLTGSSRSQI